MERIQNTLSATKVGQYYSQKGVEFPDCLQQFVLCHTYIDTDQDCVIGSSELRWYCIPKDDIRPEKYIVEHFETKAKAIEDGVKQYVLNALSDPGWLCRVDFEGKEIECFCTLNEAALGITTIIVLPSQMPPFNHQYYEHLKGVRIWFYFMTAPFDELVFVEQVQFTRLLNFKAQYAQTT